MPRGTWSASKSPCSEVCVGGKMGEGEMRELKGIFKTKFPNSFLRNYEI
jgi:hypothetical protein